MKNQILRGAEMDKREAEDKEDKIVIPMPKKREVMAILDGEGHISGYLNFRKQNKLGGRWVATFIDGIDALSKTDMTGEQWKVWAQLMCRLDFDNYLRVSRKEIADALKLKPTAVSRAMKKLKELNVIMEGPMAGRFKTYRMNPWIAHRGAKNYKTTKEEWLKMKEAQRKKRERDAFDD